MQTLRPYVSEQDENSAPGVSVFRGEFKSGNGLSAGTGCLACPCFAALVFVQVRVTGSIQGR